VRTRMDRPFACGLLLTLVASGCAHRVSEVKPDVHEVQPARAGAPQLFSSPGEAAAALGQAVQAEDRASLLKIFGARSAGLLDSGDPVADKNAFEKFSAHMKAKHTVEAQADGRYVLLVGEKDWPFPIPIVRDGGEWSFDVAAGREEMLDRRIGENELKTIRFVRSYVEAQKEYFQEDPDGDRVHEYAQRAISSAGKKDGLYWESKGKDDQSPFGPLAAEAVREGYRRKGEEPIPFHGYFFKILTAQGARAAGGKKSYFDKHGNMTKGFALVAYPARYGASGVMTFIVNQEGVVYEKDLGLQTLAEAEDMKEFNPDESWSPVADPREDAVDE
jgi:hypothetical protein